MMEIQSQPTNLTKEDVIKLIAEFQQNQCDEAQERLVDHYKNLVYSIAYRYSKGGPMHEDIIQVGMLGLLGAIRRYDYSIGNAFEPFAIPTIVGEIKKYLRDKTWGIHVPRRIKDLGGKIKLAIEEPNRLPAAFTEDYRDCRSFRTIRGGSTRNYGCEK